MNKTFLSVVALIIGLLFLLEGADDLLVSKKLADHGKAARGEVSSGEGISRPFFSSYHFRIKFQTENGIFCQQTVQVTEPFYTDTKIGDTIPIHYLPENPDMCQADDAVHMRFGKIFDGSVILAIALYWLLVKRNKTVNDPSLAAQKLSKSVQTLSIERFEYISVKAENFKHLDLSFYGEIQRALESRGFVFLADQENVTLRQRNGINTFLRCLLGADKGTMAAIYHFVPKAAMRIMGGKSSKVLDLETWLSDGTFICTNNAQSAGRLNSAPAISLLYMDSETTWDVLLQTHERRVKQYLNSNPGTAVVKLGGMADYRRAQAEMQRIKSEFRKRTGLSKTELERFAGGPNEQVDRLHDELTKRREQGV